MNFSKIAFLGTGLMGEPMCKNILKSNLPLTVWNRSQNKTNQLKNLGAEVANSPQEAVTGADVIITMLSDGAAVYDLIFKQKVAKYMQKGATHIDMGSIGADEAIEHSKKQRLQYLLK